MSVRLIAKRAVQALALVVAFPSALLCLFGRIAVLWELFAHSMALLPGLPGSFVRAAFYRLTLEGCSIDTVIGFGTYFSRRYSVIEPHVSIGSYCVLSQVRIGSRTQIASHVEMPLRNQHARDTLGRVSDSANSNDMIVIGSDCWIGASSVVMANVGDQSTIGAGSVVVKDIPARVTAVGVPAKPISSPVSSTVTASIESSI
jgi:acetyltransferase-like isoleucine patch superfamily enzyme